MTNIMNDKDMAAILEALADPNRTDDEVLLSAIKDYSGDARLYFLQGSALASAGRLIEAHDSLTKAVMLAPDFHIARFQLGFFQLTSGESDNALKTWARLDGLPKSHYLRVFVIGLRHLIRDEIADCIVRLEEGIKLNAENTPLNNDMHTIIGELKPLIAAETSHEHIVAASEEGAESDEDEEISLTSLLLRQSGSQTIQ